MPVTRVTTTDPRSQRKALEQLARLVQKAVLDPSVRETALKITSKCRSRDDMCELRAIFEAVKHGNPNVEALRHGFRYIADPRSSDLFIAPARSLEACRNGACGGDCDDHASLIASLAGTIGFKVGLRAWGPTPKSGQAPEYVHVYAVVATPKRGPFTKTIGLDSTVAESTVGWEPPTGTVLTAWLE